MQTLTFDSLPQAISEIQATQNRILSLLEKPKEPEIDKRMTVDELREMLPEHPARQTVYTWTCKRIIPFERHGRSVYFAKSAIEKWLANGRQIEEIQAKSR